MTRTAITVTFAVTRLVTVETHELNILICLAFLEHIRAGTDKFVHRLSQLFRGYDDRGRIVEGKQRGQWRIRLFERYRHRCGSVAAMFSMKTEACFPRDASFVQRSSDATTSSDVMSLPSWNLMPDRSLIV